MSANAPNAWLMHVMHDRLISAFADITFHTLDFRGGEGVVFSASSHAVIIALIAIHRSDGGGDEAW